jgi:hypothetical protein
MEGNTEGKYWWGNTGDYLKSLYFFSIFKRFFLELDNMYPYDYKCALAYGRKGPNAYLNQVGRKQ